MKHISIYILLISLISSCNYKVNKRADSTIDYNVEFAKYEQEFIEELWKQNPDWATNSGYHKYDTVLVLPGEKEIKSKLQFVQTHLGKLQYFPFEELTPSNKLDYKLIKNQLEYTKWNLEELKSYEWDPGTYNPLGTFSNILLEGNSPLEERLQIFYVRMKDLPIYYEQAKKLIRHPVPILTTLAADQLVGGVAIFEKDFKVALDKATLSSAQKEQMKERAQLAASSTKEFADWLKKLDHKSARNFRLGKDLYQKKFSFEVQSSFTADQMFQAALARKKEIHKHMATISLTLWKKYFGNAPAPVDTLLLIGKVIDTLSANHVKPKDYNIALKELVPQLLQFVKEKDLLFVDPSKPLIVRTEPAYMAGVSAASVSAPGPYDKDGNTYFNVASLEGMPTEKAENYLREYNNYIMQTLCIHEAVPGHYTQLVYANQSPSLIKSVFGNGAMVEGWANYAELMMMENGYGENSPEMWLMWYKWHLRAVCNYILDYNVHVMNMSEKEAIHLLTKEAFQQQTEAEGKWKRVSVTSVQLTNYYSGYKEIIDLREAWIKRKGKNYNLREFNEKFLSYGNSPVKYIKALMLEETLSPN